MVRSVAILHRRRETWYRFTPVSIDVVSTLKNCKRSTLRSCDLAYQSSRSFRLIFCDVETTNYIGTRDQLWCVDPLQFFAVDVKRGIEANTREDDKLNEDNIVETLKREKERLERENASLKEQLGAVKRKCDTLEASLISINEKIEGFEKTNERLQTLFCNADKRKRDEDDSHAVAKRMKPDHPRAVSVQ